MARIAINGLGRIGKLLLRALLDQGVQHHEISLLNDAVGDPELHAHLLEFDTVHGRWPAQISFDSESILVDERKIPMLAVERIEQLPLKEAGIDLVIDCTGYFKTPERVEPYFQ
ncbi:MAG: glyceraldehyde 3-phosphate dehydrogenase NAD-binding domain-containing protein, partial [Deltaproteobacteria bacterium]